MKTRGMTIKSLRNLERDLKDSGATDKFTKHMATLPPEPARDLAEKFPPWKPWKINDPEAQALEAETGFQPPIITTAIGEDEDGELLVIGEAHFPDGDIKECAFHEDEIVLWTEQDQDNIEKWMEADGASDEQSDLGSLMQMVGDLLGKDLSDPGKCAKCEHKGCPKHPKFLIAPENSIEAGNNLH